MIYTLNSIELSSPDDGDKVEAYFSDLLLDEFQFHFLIEFFNRKDISNSYLFLNENNIDIEGIFTAMPDDILHIVIAEFLGNTSRTDLYKALLFSFIDIDRFTDKEKDLLGISDISLVHKIPNVRLNRYWNKDTFLCNETESIYYSKFSQKIPNLKIASNVLIVKDNDKFSLYSPYPVIINNRLILPYTILVPVDKEGFAKRFNNNDNIFPLFPGDELSISRMVMEYNLPYNKFHTFKSLSTKYLSNT